MDPALWEMLEGEPEEELEAIIRLRQPGVAPPGVRLVAQFGEIATCRLRRSNIYAVREDEAVDSLKAARLITCDKEILSPLPERMVEDELLPTDVRRPASLQETGRGVVLGVADWGCDFVYPSFRNADGSTRLLALWDQAAPYHPEFPNRYGYGRIYTAQEINQALASQDPYAALSYHPADSDIDGEGSHATHVLDIAAGNGRNGGPIGIAPEAELVFVDLAAKGTEGLANLGDSVRLLEAVDFIFQTAGSLPWVINLSVGRHGGPHDGCTLVEQGFDALLAAVQGGAIFQSAGNYFNQRIHSYGRLRAGESTTLTIEMDEADKTPNEVEVWYSGQDVFVVEVSAPDGTRFPPVALGEQASLKIEEREVGRAYHRAHDPNNNDHHIDIFLYPGGPGGAWEIKLTGERISNGAFHAWIERDAGCWRCQSRFLEEESDSSFTTGTICNGHNTIVAGAYNPHSPDREMGSFSSAGPTRDGRPKPDFLAPGVNILAARSAPREEDGEVSLLTRKSGTSMAAPHVTGTVALMFEAVGRPLPIEETRELLLTSTRATTLPEHESIRAGRGYLDIEKAVKAASKLGGKEQYFASKTIPEERSELTVSSYTHSELDERDTLSVPAETVLANIHEPKREEETTMCNCEEKADQQVEETDVSEIWESEDDEEHEYEVFPEAVKDFGVELVGLADEAISAGKGLCSPGALIDQILSEAGITETLSPLGAGSFPSAAEIFDAFASGGSPALQRHYEQFFEVVAFPGQRLHENLCPGDFLVARALGEGRLAHSAILATGQTFHFGELASSGLRPETRLPGQYSQIVEAGLFPHGLKESFARRLTDEYGRLRHDSLILRIRQGDRPPRPNLIEAAESDAAEAAPRVVFHLFQEWHARAPASRSYRGPTDDDRRIVENRMAGGGLIAKSRLHLCFLEKAVVTLSVDVGSDVGSDVVHAKWEILDASGTVVREHPQFTAANHAAGAAAARLVTGQHAWLWDGRNSAADPVFVPAGRYRSRVTMTRRGGTSTTHETAIVVEGSPYDIQIYGEPKTDAELATLFAGVRLLDTHGERTARDCWIVVHRGATDAGHTVFLGQGTIEATIAERAPRFGAIATPRTTPFKAWIRPDPHGVRANPDRIQIQSLGRNDGHVDLTNPGGPLPVNPFTDERPHGPFKDGVQAHAGNVTGVTTNGMSVGCTTASALTGTCAAPSSVRGVVRSINSSFGDWGSGTGSQRVSVRGPSFVNKQSKRTTSLDALVADDHAAPLLDPPAPPGCGAAHDEPLHMQPTMQQAVFGGFLGHDIPRSMAVADAPVDQLRIRMELGAYAQGSIYHQYHHALAFGHEAEAVRNGFRFTIWVPRKVIRDWNGNRRNVLVRGFCVVSWTIEHLAPGPTSATTVANLIGGRALGSFVDLPEVGRLRRTWTPSLPLAAGTYTSVFKYQLELKPFVAGNDVWLAEPGGADRLSGQGATLAVETLRPAGARQFVDGENRLGFRI